MALTSDANLGPGFKGGLNDIYDRIKSGIPADELGSLTVIGEQVQGEIDANRVVQAIDNIRVSPSDAVFCYYLGHGAFDPQLATYDDTSNGHYFQLSPRDLRRHEVVARLKRKNARLTVFISDSCNVKFDSAGIFVPAPDHLVGDNWALGNLLRDHKGLVDINSSSAGQFAWGTVPRDGSPGFMVFTRSLCRVADPTIYGGKDFVTWTDFVQAVSIASNAEYQYLRNAAMQTATIGPEMLNQPNQVPQVFSLDVERTDPKGAENDLTTPLQLPQTFEAPPRLLPRPEPLTSNAITHELILRGFTMEALTFQPLFASREPSTRGVLETVRQKATNERRSDPHQVVPTRSLLDRMKIYFEILNFAMATIAAVVWGGWSYDNYVIAKQDDWSVAVDLKTDVVPIGDEQVGLRIRATFTNTGKVPALADAKKGCTLTVREHAGIEPDNPSEEYAGIVRWKSPDVEPIVDHVNLLRRYVDSAIDNPTRLFFLNPGESRQETQVVPVSKGKLYGIAVRYWGVNEHDGPGKHTLRSTASNDFVFVPR